MLDAGENAGLQLSESPASFPATVMSGQHDNKTTLRKKSRSNFPWGKT